MKSIREVTEPPQGLADYLNVARHEKYWDEFRSHDSGKALYELRETLTLNQHGLCAYCETVLGAGRRQLEHVVPRSDPSRGEALELDVANMVVCCLGIGRAAPGPAEGTDTDPGSSHGGSEESCGQAKADVWWSAFLDPRSLPPALSLLAVRADGRIEPDEGACRDTGFGLEDARRSIKTLKLNARRLLRARRSQWNDLVELSANVTDETSMAAWIRTVLTPDERGRLQPFFTTSRSYFGSIGELVLAEKPQDWI